MPNLERPYLYRKAESWESVKDNQSPTTSPPRLKQHPWSLAVLMLWTGFVISLLCLLEYAVSRASLDTNPPWSLHVLPDLLLTVFAQLHMAVTSAHLIRVAASAIRFESTAPRTWRELFWTANKSWQDPIGMAFTAQEAFQKKINVSKMFYLFAFICGIAIAIPTILTRAYQMETVPVITAITLSPTTFEPDRINLIDGNLQTGIGLGPWLTGLSVMNLYNSSMFLPESQSGDSLIAARTSTDVDPEDFFFAGDIGAAVNVSLPGLRLQGNCTPVHGDVEDQIQANASIFQTICPSKQVWTNTINARSSFQMDMRACGLTTFSEFDSSAVQNTIHPDASVNPDFGFFSYNYTADSGINGNGLIECHATVSTGNASLRGDKRTFSDFTLDPFFNVSESALGGEPLSHPLYVALSSIMGLDSSNHGALVQGFRFIALDESVQALKYIWSSPSPDDISKRLWSAISQETATIATLSWLDSTKYTGTTETLVSAYVRIQPFAGIAYALIGMWVVLLGVVTLIGYRRSVSASLDGYLVASLLAKDGRELVVDQEYGSADGNLLLRERFESKRMF
ncbi:hypothetical protein D9758_015626 [Tetrapyrgos nigripes]|uniref:Uncharacterized protein n=1 Tax=Tetrapyrgos nigripes TaxID=182062 RepID=A0A8H5CL98_9AGAR|nr:hypothetical protein D9758_015626 [Tetrapyrgos nigripes]